MLTLRNFSLSIFLIKKMPPQVFIRCPSVVAEGTMMQHNEYQDLKKILYYNNKYLINLDLSQNVDNQSLTFYKNLFFTNPKIFQHILSIAYPKALYPLANINIIFPGANIDNNNKLFVTEDFIATVAASIMKKMPLFKQGSLTILAYDNDPNKKEQLNAVAVAQTKQKNPDFHYIYKPNNKSEGIWYLYYDFKAGKSNINSGHIICFSDKIGYEYYKNNQTLKFEYEKVLFLKEYLMFKIQYMSINEKLHRLKLFKNIPLYDLLQLSTITEIKDYVDNFVELYKKVENDIYPSLKDKLQKRNKIKVSSDAMMDIIRPFSIFAIFYVILKR